MDSKYLSKENLFLFDWLTFTSTIHDIPGLIEMLGLSGDMFTQAQAGRYGYARRIFCGGISILSAGFDERMGVCVEMSGQGCRDFETLGNGDYESIFRWILENPEEMHITRLDIAFDDHTGLLDIGKVCKYTLSGQWVSRWNKYNVEYSDEGTSCTFGSRQSEMLLRIYDKAAERGITEPDVHWVRTEMVLKRQRALEFVRFICDGAYEMGHNLSDVFFGVLNNYLRFVEQDPEDNNKSRWQTAAWWSSFVQALGVVSLYVRPGVEYNLHETEKYVFNQAGNSFLTILMCRGLDAIVDGIIHRKPLFGAKYQNLVKTAGVMESVDLSVEKFQELQEYIQNYRKEYGFEKLWSPEWEEDDAVESPFDHEWMELQGWRRSV